MVARRCRAERASGDACHAQPMRDSDFCFWHDPAKADELADAQRLGGIRRRRERSVATAFDFTGLSSIESIRRLLEIAATDALSLETSIARVRALISVSVAAAKLLETGELADQLATIEGLVRRQGEARPVSDFG